MEFLMHLKIKAAFSMFAVQRTDSFLNKIQRNLRTISSLRLFRRAGVRAFLAFWKGRVQRPPCFQNIRLSVLGLSLTEGKQMIAFVSNTHIINRLGDMCYTQQC